jgi:hypothetical protein
VASQRRHGSRSCRTLASGRIAEVVASSMRVKGVALSVVVALAGVVVTELKESCRGLLK